MVFGEVKISRETGVAARRKAGWRKMPRSERNVSRGGRSDADAHR